MLPFCRNSFYVGVRAAENTASDFLSLHFDCEIKTNFKQIHRLVEADDLSSVLFFCFGSLNLTSDL